MDGRYHGKHGKTAIVPGMEPNHRIMCRHNIIPGSKGIGMEINHQYSPNINHEWNYLNKYTYSVNALDKPEIMKKLLTWSTEQQVYGLGRWGQWYHHNSDVVVEKAID